MVIVFSGLVAIRVVNSIFNKYNKSYININLRVISKSSLRWAYTQPSPSGKQNLKELAKNAYEKQAWIELLHSLAQLSAIYILALYV